MKRINKSPKLLLIFTLILLFTLALPTNSFAIISPTPQGPTLDTDQFLFIDTHVHKNGIGDVGMGMMIDFPTYSYSSSNKTLQSYVRIANYNSETNVIVGSGVSLSGTAGGGAATGLKAYNGFSSEGLFSVDPDFTVHFYMNGAWRVVKLGETWTEEVEQKPTTGDGKLIVTYKVTNYGLNDKSNITQPTPIVTETPTPTIESKKFKICGYINPVPRLNSKVECSGFKVEIPEIGSSAVTNLMGYFEISGVPQKDDGYSLKISKPGYLTRSLSYFIVNKDTELGSLSQPISIISGDINDDGAINMTDVFAIASIFNTVSSDPRFNAVADLNYDLAINMSDVMIVAGNFNKTSSAYTTPLITGLNSIDMKVNDRTTITLKEGGFAGITWKYTISDENIIKFDSKISGVPEYPDAFADSNWTFKAISKGTAEILFKPSIGTTATKYTITVTEDTTASPNPSPTAGNEPPVVDSKDLKATLISTDSEEKIVTGKNIVYCPTFQMAWDEFKNIIGGDIKLQGEPPLATRLNAGFPMLNSLSPDSYIAMAGYGQETIDKINTELKNKFNDSAPQITEKIGPADIIAYSYLGKNISFAKAFESISTPLDFTSGILDFAGSVKAFGISPMSKKSAELGKQVKIYDYKNKNDFIVKLIPDNDLDEIILAKVAPGESLYKTYSSVMNRINRNQAVSYDYRDSLKIPVLDFNIGHNYTEFEGKSLLNPGFTSYYIEKAYQRTRFKLDENGAILASEATIIGTTSIYEPKELVFDGPFMVILKEKNAVNPYLMIWVDNPELLSK